MRASALTNNAPPAQPRPSMTFEQQADLLEYFHGRITLTGDRAWITADVGDQAFIDDLWMTAQRLRRMAPHEGEIRSIVTGR